MSGTESSHEVIGLGIERAQQTQPATNGQARLSRGNSGIPPMSMDEINAEIHAYRAERQRNAR